VNCTRVLGYVAAFSLLLLHLTAEGLAGNRSDTEPERGIVTLQLDVDSDGYPHHVVVVNGVSKRADKEVLKEVKGSRFEPANKDGSPVAVHVQLQVRVDCSDPTTACTLSRLPAGTIPQSLPPLTNSAQVYRVGNGVTAPHVVTSPDPQLTEMDRDALKKATLAGPLLLDVVVNSQGVPEQIYAVNNVSPELDAKGIEAVKQWRFKPGTKDGKPVAVQIRVTMKFHLN